MITEQHLIQELRQLHQMDNAATADGEAVCLLACYLEQIGKFEIAAALRGHFNDEPEKSAPHLRLVE